MKIRLTILLVMMIAAPSYAVLTMEDAVEQYLDAVLSHDPVKIEEAWEELNAQESFIEYLKVNRPEVYDRLLNEYENRYTERERFEDDESWDIGDRAVEFPIQRRRSNREIVEDEPNTSRLNNREIAMKFPNQDLPSNQEIIRQRRRQDRSVDTENFYFEEDDYGTGDLVMLTVSGLGSRQGDHLKDLLADEFATIESIEELSSRKGVAVYLLELDSNPEDFSARLEAHTFPTFRLELVTFRPNRLDFILRSL